MTTVKFEVGRLYCVRASGKYPEIMGLSVALIDDTWRMTYEEHVEVSKMDIVLMIAGHTANPVAWFVGLVNERTVLLPKDEFVKVRV